MIEKFKRQMLKCLFLIIIILMLRWNSTGGKSLRVNLFQFYKNFFNNLQKLSDIFINNLNHQMNIFSIHKIEYPWSSLLLHLGSYIHSTFDTVFLKNQWTFCYDRYNNFDHYVLNFGFFGWLLTWQVGI